MLAASVASSFVLYAAASHAGIIATENAKAGVSPAGSFITLDDGTAASDGVVDVYPGEWSLKQGDSLHLKVRSTTGYDVSVFRLGWYGGAGATLVTHLSGQPADAQPYPTADATYGLTEAGWHVSVTIATDSTWTPGMYAARIEQPGGKMAETIFVIRDDALAGGKLPVLFLLSTATHQAYNAWPGPTRGGKSLYAFNCSSASVSSDTISPPIQAVKVSFDRPFFVGGGTADLTRYEYPFVRWLEMKGSWDVAYANDQDLQADPSIATGRKMIVLVGHAEYYSATMRNALVAARDAGTNLLFATGDTISWQVRFEAGAGGANSTMVGYKENYSKDPEYKIGAPDMTRPWKYVGHPAIELAGVESSGQIRDEYGAGKPDFAFDSKGAPLLGWADLSVNYATHWLFAGTGMASGDKIKYVMGYEVDSTLIGSTEFDPYRPPGQTLLGTITQDSDGTRKGAVGYYKAASGAEVIGMSAIAWSWALDDYAEQSASSPPPPSSIDAHAQQMMVNVFDRFTSISPPPVPDAGPAPDVGPDPDATSPDDTAIEDVPPPDAFDGAFEATPADSGAPSDTTTNPADSTVADSTTTTDSTTTDSSTPGVDSSFGDSTPPTDGGGSVNEQGSSSCSCDVPGSTTSSSFDAIAIAAAAIGLVASRKRRR